MSSALRIFLVCLLSISSNFLLGQKHYWVFFTDKDGVQFDPYVYFDKAAIEKKIRKRLPLSGYSDFPLRNDYVSVIQEITGSKVTESRWFNAVAVEATGKQILEIKKMIFVKEIREIKGRLSQLDSGYEEDLSYSQSYLLRLQLASMGRKYFDERNIDGSGIRIAVFDGGFPGVDTSPVFEHLRKNNRIIATYDFVKKDTFVYDYNSHGTSTLTCITGMLGNKKFGFATGAEFLLARTEITINERRSEEENWIAAVEWAFQHGADIISSSLGYTYHRYFPEQMDGKSTMISRAANMAASMGMLVVNAAGNDGNNKWEVIGAPADADSVLSVGGISPGRGWHIKFGSFGPTYDGRMKPNVAAFAEVVTTDEDKVKTSFGTSFSCPLVSGFAACVMQMNPDWPNMRVFSEIEKSGHLYPYFDYAHGYGIPQASYFVSGTIIPSPTFSIERNGANVDILIKEEPVRLVNPLTPEVVCCEEIYDIDREYLYFNISYAPGKTLSRYGVVKMLDADSFKIPVDTTRKGSVSIFFRGYAETYTF